MNKCVRGNPNLCIGCRTCMVACVEAHTDRPFYELKFEDIRFNPKLHMIKSYDITVPYQCRHCETPECMKVCKAGAIVHKEDRVLIDLNKCDGCGDCVSACPFGSIDMVARADLSDSRQVANKCDLCTNVDGGPRCVSVCPTSALSLVDTSEIEDIVNLRRENTLKKMSNS